MLLAALAVFCKRMLVLFWVDSYLGCFLDRDEFMVCNAAHIIAYYDGRERGETYYTIKKARE